MNAKAMLLSIVIVVIVAMGLLAIPGCNQPASDIDDQHALAEKTSSGAASTSETTSDPAWQKREGYVLEQVVAVSRHNLRAPLVQDEPALKQLTSNAWIEWSANPSELTDKGGVAETIMGEFFREWLETEGLIPENYIPDDDAVRFYANPRQRTVATAQFFSSGMLPVANTRIEYHGDYDSRDPVFKPVFDYQSESFENAVLEEVAELGGNGGIAGWDEGLQDSYNLLIDVTGYKESDGYASGQYPDLQTGSTAYAVELGKEPQLSGPISVAKKLADALILQYYEADDLAGASFGKELSWDQWRQIAAVKDAYIDLCFGSHLAAIDCAYPLLKEIGGEIDRPGRVFTFICGHDSNMSALLHALGVLEYQLPDSLESKIPIGSKILFERWSNASGEQFANVRLVYATTEQLRNLDLLSLSNAPASCNLDFEGIARNEDGLFSLKDVQSLFDEALSAHDGLATAYP